MAILYHKNVVEVHPGDRVTIRRWFRQVDATIVHVPGISPPHKNFGDAYFQEVGVRTQAGRIYGVMVEPSTAELKETVKFCRRGTATPVIADELDDPFVENDDAEVR